MINSYKDLAEGAGRNNRREYMHFCGMAAGSASELETQLIIMKRVYILILIHPKYRGVLLIFKRCCML
jgi:four helix bundle protein